MNERGKSIDATRPATRWVGRYGHTVAHTSSQPSRVQQHVPDDDHDLTRLQRIAADLDWRDLPPTPCMPGLAAFGANADPSSFGAHWGVKRGVAGVGITEAQAFRRCLGEAMEHLSQHIYTHTELPPAVKPGQGDGDALHTALLALAQPAATSDTPWIAGKRLDSMEDVAVPLDFCWRRDPTKRPLAPRFAAGLGCAAGRNTEAATRAAILEVVERDALALWWRGGRRARPIEVDVLAHTDVADVLGRLRGGNRHRRSWFLDITNDTGIPVVVAISVDHDGGGFAFGAAAALTLEEALVPACLELGQVELIDFIVAIKAAQGGVAGLNAIDRLHFRRNEEVRADWPILHPHGHPAGSLGNSTQPTDDDEAVTALVDRLAASGHAIVLVDQTNPKFEVPVVRALSPTLQPLPADIETPRLLQARAAVGEESAASRPPII